MAAVCYLSSSLALMRLSAAMEAEGRGHKEMGEEENRGGSVTPRSNRGGRASEQRQFPEEIPAAGKHDPSTPQPSTPALPQVPRPCPGDCLSLSPRIRSGTDANTQLCASAPRLISNRRSSDNPLAPTTKDSCRGGEEEEEEEGEPPLILPERGPGPWGQLARSQGGKIPTIACLPPGQRARPRGAADPARQDHPPTPPTLPLQGQGHSLTPGLPISSPSPSFPLAPPPLSPDPRRAEPNCVESGDRCGDSEGIAELKIHHTSVAEAGAAAPSLPPLTGCRPDAMPTCGWGSLRICLRLKREKRFLSGGRARLARPCLESGDVKVEGLLAWLDTLCFPLGAGELSMQPSAPALFVPLLMALWREGDLSGSRKASGARPSKSHTAARALWGGPCGSQGDPTS
ncbi:unnamed protein product [Pleuronectes platessa]|uniref:Uncharacterized protein n=1 Tax=Pleuronectes platessa TaxID=8262 RepID=A0A9N7VXP8_PLEPL|nr:unnamed protein product [Pleuronectes platessa]